jgi:hypothetical protein
MACSFTFYSINGIVAPGNVDPTVLRVTGHALCPLAGNQVAITANITTSSGPVTLSSGPLTLDQNFDFRVDLPISAVPLPQCGSPVTVRPVGGEPGLL